MKPEIEIAGYYLMCFIAGFGLGNIIGILIKAIFNL